MCVKKRRSTLKLFYNGNKWDMFELMGFDINDEKFIYCVADAELLGTRYVIETGEDSDSDVEYWESDEDGSSIDEDGGSVDDEEGSSVDEDGANVDEDDCDTVEETNMGADSGYTDIFEMEIVSLDDDIFDQETVILGGRSDDEYEIY